MILSVPKTVKSWLQVPDEPTSDSWYVKHLGRKLLHVYDVLVSCTSFQHRHKLSDCGALFPRKWNKVAKRQLWILRRLNREKKLFYRLTWKSSTTCIKWENAESKGAAAHRRCKRFQNKSKGSSWLILTVQCCKRQKELVQNNLNKHSLFKMETMSHSDPNPPVGVEFNAFCQLGKINTNL